MMGWNGPARQCVVCHNLEKATPIGSAPTSGASSTRRRGLKGFTAIPRTGDGGWGMDQQDLDRYLANPNQFLPAPTKRSRSGTPRRVKIIAFLALLKD